MIKTNKVLLGLGLSTAAALPLVIVSCSSGEEVIEDNVLTTEVTNNFFATGGKWEGKTALVAADFEGFENIGNSALSGKSLVSVIFSDSITKIGQNALENNALTSLNIPNSVIEIGDGAFNDNPSLTIDSPITLPAQFDTLEERRRIGLPFEQPAINLELTPKTNIEAIMESEVAHLTEVDQNVNAASLALIKKLFDINVTNDENLTNGLKIKMVTDGLNKTISLTTIEGFTINGTLNTIDSTSFTIDIPPIDPPITGNVLTEELVRSFFATGGKWAEKTALVAADFEGFTSIADSALSGKSLVSVIFSDSITKIGQNALENNALTSLNIPNSVIEIGDGAFNDNPSLTIDSPITLPAQFDTLEERRRIGLPFEQPAINLELTPKTNIEAIMESEVAHLTEVDQNVNAASLALIKKLFDINVTNDENLTNGLKIKMVTDGLNKTISLTTIEGFTINGTLNTIDSTSFTIDIPPIDPPITGNVLTEELVRSFFATGGKWAEKTALVAADFEGFTSIADSALSGKSLVSVIFSDSITKIGQNALENNALTSLNIPNSVIEIGDGAFNDNPSLTIDSPITLPAQFDTLEERRRIGLPFEQPAINLELTPKTNIEAIMESEVAHLTEVDQNVNAASLALIKKLFDINVTNDENLTNGLKIKMVTDGLNKTISLTTIEGFTINGTLNTIDSTSFTIDIPPIDPPITGNVLTEELVRSFFATGGKWAEKTALVAADFEGFTSIGENAFQGLNNLSSVDLPNEIIRIENQAFFQTHLTHITLGNGVQHIGDSAFSHCFITEIILPSSLKTMGEQAFSQNNLTNIIIPSSLKIIPNIAFTYNKLTSITIPNSVTHIGDGAFFDNELTEVNIPDSVTSIGSTAFQYNRFAIIPTLPNGILVGDIFDNQKVNPSLEIYTRKTIK